MNSAVNVSGIMSNLVNMPFHDFSLACILNKCKSILKYNGINSLLFNLILADVLAIQN